MFGVRLSEFFKFEYALKTKQARLFTASIAKIFLRIKNKYLYLRPHCPIV